MACFSKLSQRILHLIAHGQTQLLQLAYVRFKRSGLTALQRRKFGGSRVRVLGNDFKNLFSPGSMHAQAVHFFKFSLYFCKRKIRLRYLIRAVNIMKGTRNTVDFEVNVVECFMRKSRSSVALVKPERWASSASIAETPTSFDSVSFYSLFRAKPVLLYPLWHARTSRRERSAQSNRCGFPHEIVF